MRRALLAVLLLAPAVTVRGETSAEAEPARAIALMRDAAGKQVGTATLAQDLQGVRIAIGVKGLSPGKHGFHLHEAGRCDAPDFATAGGHFNPGQKPHGAAGSSASHAGDLPDLEVGPDGVVQVGFIARGLRLEGGPASLLAGGGTALVIDGGGARVACGVVTRR
jgi:Cu-Zn family superoxide dismutase